MDMPLASRRATLGLLAAGAGLLTPLARTSAATAIDTAALLDSIAWNLLRAKPERATSLGIDTGPNAALRAQLEDKSPAGQAATAAGLRADLARLATVDTTMLDAATRTSVEVVRSAYGVALEGFALPYGEVAVGEWRNSPYVVIQNTGAYLDLPRFLGADHPVRNVEDAEAWLARLSGFGAQLDGETQRLRSATQAGLIPPDFLLDKAIAQIGATIADARSADGGQLVRTLARLTSAFPGKWPARAAALVTGEVIPALERQRAELQALRPRAVSTPGMAERPHGSDYYAWALRASTTTRLTPREVHQLGVQQLADIHARMDPILRKLGYTQGSVAQRAVALQNDPRYTFPPNDSGRHAIVAAMEERLSFIRTRLPAAFRRLVDSRVEIRRLPLAEESGAPPAYGGAGSIDGSVPGRVWVNLGDTTMHNRVNIGDLVFHEGLPGHVWQGNYALSMPLIRTILSFNAYSEGWALYAEQLADELAAYDEDPAGRIGYLAGLAWRAVRLVVDTGIHASGWSRARARTAFIEATGLPAATAASEVDRYCSWPGQACGYKVGHNEITRQRERARQALGDAYDLRDFNQAVVDGGNVPLEVLAANVERYIASRRAGAS